MKKSSKVLYAPRLRMAHYISYSLFDGRLLQILYEKKWCTPPKNTRSKRKRVDRQVFQMEANQKSPVESQPIVTDKATLRLTILAPIKSSTKDLAREGKCDEEKVSQKVI